MKFLCINYWELLLQLLCAAPAECWGKKLLYSLKQNLKDITMWEKINKVLIQNAIAVIVIAGCLLITAIASFHEVPKENQQLINKFFDMCLVGVIGWLFTQSKSQKQ